MFIVFWLVLQRAYFYPRALRMQGETKGVVGMLIFRYREEKFAAVWLKQPC